MESIGFGVCRLATVSVMKEPEWSSLQLTQLLFGEYYLVLSKTRNGWLEIFMPITGITGWMRFEQHHEIIEEYYRQIEISDFRITTDVSSVLLFRKQPVSIVMGSLVPVNATELFKVEEQLAFNGEAKLLSQKRDAEFLEAVALKYLNAPERPGGRTTFGIDSDAFIRLVYRLAGYSITTNFTNLQKNLPSVEFDDMKPGDLAYFTSNKKNHYGIILTGARVIGCLGHVRIDSIQDNSLSTETQHWVLTDIRRILS
jgi:hypothetical protein